MELPLHPILVHFPIALLITSVLFDAAGVILKREALREGALWLLILGLVGGIAAAGAGLYAEEAAEKAGIAESLIERHETLAFVTLAIFGTLLGYRLFLRNQLAQVTLAVYLIGAVVGIGTLSATGYFGGHLVYEHGAGVKATGSVVPPLARSADEY